MNCFSFFCSAPQCLAWYSVDKPFAVGYPDGKILLAAAESYETDPPILLTAFPVSMKLRPKSHTVWLGTTFDKGRYGGMLFTTDCYASYAEMHNVEMMLFMWFKV